MFSDTFSILKISENKYTVKSKFNEYSVMVDKNKGTGIYLVLDDGKGILVKNYNHTKLETAFNYLMRKELFI